MRLWRAQFLRHLEAIYSYFKKLEAKFHHENGDKEPSPVDGKCDQGSHQVKQGHRQGQAG